MLYVAKRDSLDVTKGKVYEAKEVIEYGEQYFRFIDNAGDERFWREGRFALNFEPKPLLADEEFRNALL